MYSNILPFDVDSSHACVQTIFGVLDHLKVWLRNKFSSGDDKKPKDQRQTGTCTCTCIHVLKKYGV